MPPLLIHLYLSSHLVWYLIDSLFCSIIYVLCMCIVNSGNLEWTKVEQSDAPGKRWGHACGLNHEQRRLVLSGGIFLLFVLFSFPSGFILLSPVQFC